MYKVEILTSGKYNNVMVGNRYCFTRRETQKMVNAFLELGCELDVTKLIRCGGTVFCWGYDHKIVLPMKLIE